MKGRKIQASTRKKRKKAGEFLQKFPMDEFLLIVTSTMVKKIKKSIKGFGRKIGNAFSALKRVKNPFTGGGSSLRVRKKPEKPKRMELREALREIKGQFSPPKPEITAFRLGKKRFLPYSTSEAEETRGNFYYSSLSSLHSAGRNIFQSVDGVTDPVEDFALGRTEVYTLLPAGEGEMICVNRVGGPWLVAVRSKASPQERISLPKEKPWEEYSFKWPNKGVLKIHVERKLDFILRGEEENWSLLVEPFKASYSAGIESLGRLQSGGRIFYIIRTPASKLSPFLAIRLAMKWEERELQSHIYPAWLDYGDLKLIRTTKMLKEAYQQLGSRKS